MELKSFNLLSCLVLLLSFTTPHVQIQPLPLSSNPQGSTIYVNSNVDEISLNGLCSLREAILAANTNTPVDECQAGSGADIIIVPSGTYTLTLEGAYEDTGLTGDLDIYSDLKLQGAGASATFINGNSVDRVFQVHPAAQSVTFDGLNINNQMNNSTTFSGEGVGILNAGVLTVTHTTLENNSWWDTGGGGAIANSGDLYMANSVLSNNSAGPYAEGGGIDNHGQATIVNTLISGNYAASGGGIFNQGTLTLQNSSLQGNVVGRGTGGGISNSLGTTTIQATQVISNSAKVGGGIVVSDGSLSIENSIVSYNGAEFGGNGIYQTGGELIIASTEVSYNTPVYDDEGGGGGGMLIIGGSASIANSSIGNNQTAMLQDTYMGGGIYLGSASLDLAHTVIASNEAQDGGGIAIETGGVLVADTITVTQNTAVNGGGIYNLGTLQLNGSTVNSNEAKSMAGGIYNLGDLNVEQSSVNSNYTEYDAQVAGLYNAGTANIEDSSFMENLSYMSNYGGILNSGTLTMTNSILANNVATKYVGGGFTNTGTAHLGAVQVIGNGGGNFDGGIIQAGSSFILENSQVMDNSAGGIAVYSAMTITHSTVGRNSRQSGAGIYLYGGELWMSDSTLSANEAEDSGSALQVWQGIAHLDHLTIADNDVTGCCVGTGGAIAINQGGVYLHSTLLAGNQDLSGSGHPDCSAPPGTIQSLGYNLVGNSTGCNWVGSSGDLTGTAGDPIDPRLAPLDDHGGQQLTHALLIGSPALDAADASNCLPDDQRGVPRPQGSVCDIGAYEAIYARVGNGSANEGDGSLVFTVTLTAPSPEAVSFQAVTHDDTALAGSDYLPLSTTITIPAGSSSYPIPVSLLDDLLREPVETFLLELGSSYNLVFSDEEAAGQIIDNDPFRIWFSIFRR